MLLLIRLFFFILFNSLAVYNVLIRLISFYRFISWLVMWPFFLLFTQVFFPLLLFQFSIVCISHLEFLISVYERSTNTRNVIALALVVVVVIIFMTIDAWVRAHLRLLHSHPFVRTWMKMIWMWMWMCVSM